MADHLGTYNASSTVRFMFTTHAATGAPVAPNSAFEAADLLIYKDGSATQRSSASGITVTSPFDSIVGLHSVAIDLSDNTDASFYAAGSEYAVVLSPDETVDSLAVVKVLAHFSIERVAKVNVTQFGGSAGTFASGRPDVNMTYIAGSAVSTSTAQLGVNVVNFGGSAGTFSSGRPEVNASHISGSSTAADNVEVVYSTDFATNYNTTLDCWVARLSSGTGTGQLDFTSGVVKANVTQYDGAAGASTGGIPWVDVRTAAGVTWTSGAITAASLASNCITAAQIADGAIDAATFAADARALFGVIDYGTAQSATSTTIVLQSGFTASDDVMIGATVFVRSSTNGTWARSTITDWVSSTDTATVEAWVETPTGTISYVVFATAAAPTSLSASFADAVWDEATSGHTTSGTFGEQCKTDIDAILEDTATTIPATITTIDGIVDDILVDTAVIGAAGAGLTAIPWNASWDTEVQSECTDALNAYDPPTNTEMEARTIAAASYATASALSTVAGYLDTEIAAILADTNELQTDWANNGRLDVILDAILDDTGTSGVALATGVITAGVIATDAIGAAEISAAAANKIADHVRRRTQANVEASSDGDTLGISSEYGMIQQAQESNTVDNAGKLTTYRTDGTTELAQKTITTDDTAEPITGIS